MTGKLQSWMFSLAILAIGFAALIVYGSYLAEIKAAFRPTAQPVNSQAELEYQRALQFASGANTIQDRQKAIDLITLSAEHGFSEAQFLLGDAYYRGELGQDYRQAYIWFTVATNNGLAKAAPLRYEVAAYLSPAELRSAQQEVNRYLQNHIHHQ